MAKFLNGTVFLLGEQAQITLLEVVVGQTRKIRVRDKDRKSPRESVMRPIDVCSAGYQVSEGHLIS